MIKHNLLFVLFAICALSAIQPATSMTRWFSSAFQDVRYTLHRFGHCIGGLTALKDYQLNETDFLAYQIKVFLDQGNYDNEQLQNVSLLMDTICRSDDTNTTYAISANIDVGKYTNGQSNPLAKDNRCRSIDEALDAMYPVFRRAALNSSEKLDFSVIQFYPNRSDPTSFYNLTDLINTSWIKSEMLLESICHLTNSVRVYVQSRTSNSTAQDRLQSHPARETSRSIVEFIDRVLDPIFGSLKRLSWEGSNRYEQVMAMLGHGYGGIRDGIGWGLSATGKQIANLFNFARAANSTAAQVNSKPAQVNLNFTKTPPMSVSRISPTPSTAAPKLS